MIDRRFVYTGSAVGLGARITRIGKATGLPYVVPVQGASALPQTGGLSESQTGPFVYRITDPKPMDLVSVGSTTTRASGTPSGSWFVTEAMASAQSVNFYDMLRFDSLSATMKSTHDGQNEFPLIAPQDVSLTGLRLGDYGVEVIFDLEPFQCCQTKRSLGVRYATDPAFRAANYWRFNADPDAKELPEFNGFYVGSAVKEIRWTGNPHPDATIDGYTIIWDGFGKIILGEMLISNSTRKMTVVRLKMGSDIDGDGSGGAVESDSHTMP